MDSSHALSAYLKGFRASGSGRHGRQRFARRRYRSARPERRFADFRSFLPELLRGVEVKFVVTLGGAAVAIVMNKTPNNPTEFFRKRCTSADAVWFGGASVTDMFTGIFLIQAGYLLDSLK